MNKVLTVGMVVQCWFKYVTTFSTDKLYYKFRIMGATSYYTIMDICCRIHMFGSVGW